MYTDNFEEEILFIPARKDGEACNHLKIVTAFTDVERISSHLIKLFDGRNKEYVSGIKVDIILGMTKGTGLTQKKHDKICSLIKRLNSVSGMPQISCNYIVEGKQVHSKVYVWCRGRKAIEAFNGSANYTMNAFFVRRECMDACNPKEANHYFNSLLPDTINCFDGQIKDKVSFSKVSVVPKNERGYIPKKVQIFNNSVGYASAEQGGNLIIKEQWLENPVWDIYVLIDCEEAENLAGFLQQGKCVYFPYLGKNDHPADITNVEKVVVEEITLKETVISSMFLKETGSLIMPDDEDDIEVFKYAEKLPIALNGYTNLYEYADFCYTNMLVDINNDKLHKLYKTEDKILEFY